MTEELQVEVGTSAVVVAHGHRSYECYDVKVEKVTLKGHITVSFVARGGYHLTKRFYPAPYNKGYYREHGRSSGYSATSYDIYFGARADKERAAVLEWRTAQTIWEKMDAALVAMPSRWGRVVPTNEDIADVRSKLAVVIEVLNRAEKWQHEKAKDKAVEELNALVGADTV
jgi:hypothetical protein